MGCKPTIRLLVTGDRNWTDSLAIQRRLQTIGIENISVLIHGDAPGADRLAAQVAYSLGLSAARIKAYPANWTQYGKAAGPIRNQQMLTEGRPTHCSAFHSDLNKSKGTRDMVKRARRALGHENVWISGKDYLRPDADTLKTV